MGSFSNFILNGKLPLKTATATQLPLYPLYISTGSGIYLHFIANIDE